MINGVKSCTKVKQYKQEGFRVESMYVIYHFYQRWVCEIKINKFIQKECFIMTYGVIFLN